MVVFIYDLGFNVLVRIFGVGFNILLGWYMEDMVEMREVIWYRIEEGVRKFREVVMLEWVCLKLEKLLFDYFF